jgi:ATP-dependent Lhr-like helicase
MSARRARSTVEAAVDVVDVEGQAHVGEAWFAARGWQAFPFQREVWSAMAEGKSGLLHATTGSGKTYAVWFGALERARAAVSPRLGVLWLTPMRALAADSARAMQAPIDDLGLPWTIGIRTGDTPAAERAKQDRRFPSALVTTPESLSLMLTREAAREELAGVHTVIVDEWHELMGNKRGVQVQLALARLRRWNPRLVVWGLSATLGNLDEAMHVLLGHEHGLVVKGRIEKNLVIDTLLPDNPGRFSWGGHLGKQMQRPVVDEIERSTTTLVFVNVRSQAEAWYQLILAERPDWAGVVALHHGSLDKEVREWVELGLKEGRLKAVVATSSLDLGVDFLPVERVLQIGSAKGVARLLQRAGRSGHAPGRASRITLVPTNTLELVEAVAARRAALAGRIEKRATPDKPFDVLVQHLVTIAIGGGFTADAMHDEVKGAWAYRKLTAPEFQWALDFVVKGGDSLAAYPEYHRVVADADGIYRVPNRAIARRHKLNVGTIVSDASMQVKYLSGGRIGVVEEGFVARLKPGDCFVFAGRTLEFVRAEDMTAWVKRASTKRAAMISWAGAKMPLSSELADSVVEVLADAAQGDFFEPEMEAARPMLETQAHLSRIPTPKTLLIEKLVSREGQHLFLYPFAGRNAHIGLGSLLAWRLSKDEPNTFSIVINDYGFELLSAKPVDPASLVDQSLFAEGDAGELLHDVLASLNSSELARRRFREIARVSGLVSQGFPGQPKSTRQLQASSSLFYEVFRKYDGANLLLGQAEREVLSQELDIKRLAQVLRRMREQRVVFVELAVPSPFALPLMVERFREKLSTEKLKDRLERMLREMEKEAQRP